MLYFGHQTNVSLRVAPILQELNPMRDHRCNTWIPGFAACLLTMLAPLSAASGPQPPEGFTALFDGKTLAGWKGLVENPVRRAGMLSAELVEAQKKADERMRAHWKVVGGVLEFDGKGDSLCTARDYGDFELYVDWKILEDGDSGIYLRGSPQLQIWDTESEKYRRYGNDKGSGALWNNKVHPRFPLVKADLPVGQWNTFYIKMVGDRVTVKLNGKLVTDQVVMENYWDRSRQIDPRGQIELQSHGNRLWFRNIYVRELDGGTARATAP